jgi:hypothetical protein
VQRTNQSGLMGDEHVADLVPGDPDTPLLPVAWASQDNRAGSNLDGRRRATAMLTRPEWRTGYAVAGRRSPRNAQATI